MKYSSNSVFTRLFSVELNTTTSLKLLILIPHLVAFLIVSLFWVVSILNSSFTVFWISIICLGTIIGITFSLVYFLRLHIWKMLKLSIFEIHQHSKENWTVVCENKDIYPVELLSSSFVSPFLVVLNFRGLNNTIYTAVITPDSLSDQDFRHLRVRVKLS